MNKPVITLVFHFPYSSYSIFLKKKSYLILVFEDIPFIFLINHFRNDIQCACNSQKIIHHLE